MSKQNKNKNKNKKIRRRKQKFFSLFSFEWHARVMARDVVLSHNLSVSFLPFGPKQYLIFQNNLFILSLHLTAVRPLAVWVFLYFALLWCNRINIYSHLSLSLAFPYNILSSSSSSGFERITNFFVNFGSQRYCTVGKRKLLPKTDYVHGPIRFGWVRTGSSLSVVP